MINVDGVRWGTAAEVAAQLGHGVTEATVRSWTQPSRGGLSSARLRDGAGRPQVRYSLSDAARIGAAKRHGGRGRQRQSRTSS